MLVHVGFVMGTIALGQIFLQRLQFFPFILIPLVLHVHISCIYHQCSIILAFDSVIKEITSFPFPPSGECVMVCM